MRKTLTAAMAALTFGAAVSAAVPAQARDDFRGDYGRDDHRGSRATDAGVVIAAGIVGLALGAALTSGSHSTAYGYGYARPDASHRYYGPRYDGGGYRTCESTRWVYDRYLRRDVQVRSLYAC
jgi:hypothetical protein